MDLMRELISATTLYMTNHSEVRTSIPWTEIVAGIAAVLSLFGLIITTIINVRTAKKSQNANARVEWIQKVRNTTAELIAMYYSALNEDDKENVQKIIIGVREKVELLTLYFGPEVEIQNSVIDILDQKSNEGKNQLIVDCLEQLSKDFLRYNRNIQRDTRSFAEKRRSEAEIKYQDSLRITDHEEVEVEGQVYDSYEYEADPVAEKELEKRTEELKEIDNFNQELEDKLTRLRDIIRIYLKIEWNKAKKGK